MSNEEYIKKLNQCKEQHICYSCGDDLPEEYTKLRCKKCLKEKKQNRKNKHKEYIQKEYTPVREVVNEPKIENRGQQLKHKIIVDENIEIGVKIPEVLTYNEIMVLFDTISKMIKPFVKQNNMIGSLDNYTTPTGRKPRANTVHLTKGQMSTFVRMWDGHKPKDREQQLKRLFPELESWSYAGLTKKAAYCKDKLSGKR